MKFRILYKFLALAFLAFIFQSRSSGPAGIAGLRVTGAPGDNGTCGNTGCHAAGQFDPSTTIELLDGSTPITAYEAGKEYTVRISITAGNGSPINYGFQATSLDTNNGIAGSFTPGTGQQAVSIAGKEYLEHSTPSQGGEWTSTWIAPTDAGAGDVTFYVASSTNNGNGSPTGDGASTSTLTLAEDLSNSTSSIDRDYAKMSIAPNPVADQAKLLITSRTSGLFAIRIADISGKTVLTQNINLIAGQNETIFDVSNLGSGAYVVQLSGEAYITSTQMIKL